MKRWYKCWNGGWADAEEYFLGLDLVINRISFCCCVLECLDLGRIECQIMAGHYEVTFPSPLG